MVMKMMQPVIVVGLLQTNSPVGSELQAATADHFSTLSIRVQKEA